MNFMTAQTLRVIASKRARHTSKFYKAAKKKQEGMRE
jgi:hypothetical protein